MIKINDIIEKLDLLLNSKSFSDYGPNGLQVEGKKEVQKISFAVSATVESIEKSLEWGSDCLITHHGILWGYQKAKRIVGPHYKRIKSLIDGEMNLISYHLPLDAHLEHGNAAGIAKKLDLVNIEPFGDYRRNPLGVSGKFKAPLKADELKAKLKKMLNHEVIHADPGSDLIRSIGIITGGANNEWPQALESGLDAYLTGEISEYNWHDSKEAGIHYFACGHHATEKFGVLSLEQFINENFKGIETIFFDSTNPA